MKQPMTAHFSLTEFDCHDGTDVPTSLYANVQLLMNQLEIIRSHVGPLEVLSGYRTPSHNRRIGGVPQSQHLTAKAADIVNRSLTPYKLHKIISDLISKGEILDGGLGLYPSFVHYDVGKPRRWRL